MMRRTSVLGYVLAAAISSGFAQTRWEMPTGYDARNFHTENILQFAADVKQASGGKLNIVVHPAGSLFKANEIKRAVQGSLAPIGEIFISGFARETPIFGADSIPFLASTYADADKLWRAMRPATEAHLSKDGIKVLFSVPWPPQVIFSVKPINSAADLKNARWRAYNPATARIAQLVGAKPITIQAAELDKALAAGLVDAFMTSSATGYDVKAWQHMKYCYDVRGWIPRNLVVVSQNAFDELDAPSREALLRSAAAAEARGRKISEEKNGWYLDQLARNGLRVEQPSARLRADLGKLGESMTVEWIKQAGPEGQRILEAFRK